MSVILVQHCQSQHHVDPSRYFPDRHNGLTDLGKRQAQRVAGRLADELRGREVALFSSDMTRARETARIVAAALHVEPQWEPRLREWSDPLFMDRTEPPAWTTPDSGQALFDWRPFPEHESWREFHARVSEFMTEQLQSATDRRAPVFVVHGGTLSNIVVWWLGIPLDVLSDRTCFAASPGSVSVLMRNRFGKPVIGCLNDRQHLSGLT